MIRCLRGMRLALEALAVIAGCAVSLLSGVLLLILMAHS
jgi:hypothetical protein